ncbi:MAG TPA: carboxypeptidase-like regulatory domain-containing protein, partial [Fibrobacteria bacterium]|nr:carboxypeptidase-like regulatory domain-containing protein [Fibrobacteria bacterium]
MPPDRARIASLAASVWALGVLCGCGVGDPFAGGSPIGTETGNALTGRILKPDGSPAAHARVVVRASDALDSTQSGERRDVTTDGDGSYSLRLPTGSWTLEASLDSLGLRQDLELEGDRSQGAATLAPLRDLEGRVLGVDSGRRIYLPGLARSEVVGAKGVFRFPRLPRGAHRLVVPPRGAWTLTEPNPDRPVLSLANPGRILTEVARLEGVAGALRRVSVPDSNWPARPGVVAADGSELAWRAGPSRQGLRRLWCGSVPASGAILVDSANGSGSSPFAGGSGLVAAWIPDLDPAPLVGGSGIQLDSSGVSRVDSLEGEVRRVPLASRLASLGSMALPD